MDDTSQTSQGSWGGQQAAPVASAGARPDWLPEAHWDAQAGGMKPEFGTHYQELTQFKRAADERAATIPATPDGYKLEMALPESVKLPDGMQIQINENDPRLAITRAAAKEVGLDQKQFSRLLALEAEFHAQAHTAEMARVAAEDAKLGDNGKVRKEAVSNWANGLRDRSEITKDEYEEILQVGAFAAGVTLLEKLIAKSSGSVPGGGGSPPSPPKPSDIPMEQRWYGANSQQSPSMPRGSGDLHNRTQTYTAVEANHDRRCKFGRTPRMARVRETFPIARRGEAAPSGSQSAIAARCRGEGGKRWHDIGLSDPFTSAAGFARSPRKSSTTRAILAWR